MTAPHDNDSEAQLRSFIKRVLNLREERKAITDDIAMVAKEAKGHGFDSVKITEVCRWLERCEKHGRDKMVEAEAIFDLYRTVAEGPERPLAEMFDDMRDKALVEMFAGKEPAKPSKRVKGLNAARFAAQQARRALED